MRQLAWLQAPIDPPKGIKDAEPGPSRGKQAADAGEEPELPELEDGMHIVHALMEAGPISAGGMGPATLSWTEIEAWQRVTQSTLQPHELVLLRELSSVYLDQWLEAKDRHCPSPEILRPEGDKAKRLVGHIKGVLRS